MNQKFPSVFITIGLSIFLLITCSCEGETQKAEPLSSIYLWIPTKSITFEPLRQCDRFFVPKKWYDFLQNNWIVKNFFPVLWICQKRICPERKVTRALRAPLPTCGVEILSLSTRMYKIPQVGKSKVLRLFKAEPASTSSKPIRVLMRFE